jgi:hypothetical protein
MNGFGFRLDKFAIAGFNNEPLPSNLDEIELLAYQSGRYQAGHDALTVVASKSIEGKGRESDKTLAIVGT